MIWSVK